ncbi:MULTISPECIES: hypothetical protein [Streptomyces]|uniref:hypothetical protein n=1 Tax=Streptomyces TaxID=1883 RepID=UPI00131772DD|nr:MULTISPECIES: hypothetical protein [Streptomyces]QGZ49175.1 hypothetical protein GPZ77_12980 [Streptomyces sp. QHH-9511]GGT90865.1 hypothetical protein GCM10010272_39570 [Streptomyces lateritius]
MTAQHQCDGTISPGAAGALEKVLNTRKFNHAPGGWLTRTTEQLQADYDARARWTLKLHRCKVHADPGPEDLAIDFGLYDNSDLVGNGRISNMHPYEMGIEAHAGFMKAYIFAECVSPQLKGSQERPARIRGTLNVGTPVPSDTVATREANLTVLHSVALAVVKKLGCENNAGLPDKPVLKAKSITHSAG